ncbi:Cytidine and deoxycytidylate deaminase zinc-binding region [Streptomyces sp. cf386]|uniref:nucleoside deaminase n=1 Tax=Streptomyces sp. cf386 TaxID=1761904 RepID=UPI00088FC628|nr:nucleoside deaminase [Streptomyces sp. cf386]SDP05113.1 Cytidine and deoxycytidylate deaminase zinc-binding region [Streptomyces sp. cf386]
MDSGRRQLLGRWGAVVAGVVAPVALHRHTAQASHARPDPGAGATIATDLRTGEGAGALARHERFMWLAVEQARRNPKWPFGAVIVGTRTGEVLGWGVNTGAENPMLHGEVVAMNDYVRRHGNQGWADTTLYTTGEPCSMCMSAMAWADLRRVVWASSIDEIRRTDIIQIDLPAREVAASARSFYHPELLLGGVLADHTNSLFEEAQRLRRKDPDAPKPT